MTEEQLSALLRVKRYEQPPAEYFEQLLRDVHHRQRAELLRLPLWKIAMERVQTFFGEHSMSHLTYSGALASVLVVGVTTIGLMTTRQGGRPQFAVNTPTPAGGSHYLQLGTSKPNFGIDSSPSLQVGSQLAQASSSFSGVPKPELVSASSSQPRYIMDTRPAVNYEMSSF
jgi:hypothetical protein